MTEKFPVFFPQKICFAFWVPVIISDILPTHPSVLGPEDVRGGTDRQWKEKSSTGHKNLQKGFDEWRVARGWRAGCLLCTALFDEIICQRGWPAGALTLEGERSVFMELCCHKHMSQFHLGRC